jgi:hypothetical protein
MEQVIRLTRILPGAKRLTIKAQWGNRACNGFPLTQPDKRSGLSVFRQAVFTIKARRSKLEGDERLWEVLVTLVRCTRRIFSVICFAAALIFSGHSNSHASLAHVSDWIGDALMTEKPRTRQLPTGTWGGEHIRLEVAARQVWIEYDCAHATIDKSIILDRNGRFDVSGMHFSERGGPVRRGSVSRGYAVRFVGQVKGKEMSLTVTNSETNESIGTFTLTYGQQPRLMKCK